jgi:hypothetical protein
VQGAGACISRSRLCRDSKDDFIKEVLRGIWGEDDTIVLSGLTAESLDVPASGYAGRQHARPCIEGALWHQRSVPNGKPDLCRMGNTPYGLAGLALIQRQRPSGDRRALLLSRRQSAASPQVRKTFATVTGGQRSNRVSVQVGTLSH